MEKVVAWLRCHPLLAVLLLSLVLRLICLQSRNTWYDDAFSIFLSRRSLPEIVYGTTADTMPPLYYFLLHYWLRVGQQLWFVRLLSVLLSLMAVALFYQLVESWSDRKTAVWAAAFASISPLMIYYAQEVRMYALLVLGQLGYLLFFTRLWKNSWTGRPSALNWAGLIFCGVVTMYTHNMAVFGLIVSNVFLLFRREWKKLLQLVLAQVLIGVLALPWLLLLPGQIARAESAWPMPKPGVVEILQAVIMLGSAMPLPVPFLVLALLLNLQILAVLGLGIYRRRSDMKGLAFWMVLFLLPPLLMLAVSYIVLPVFAPRTFIISALGYNTLAALVVVHTWSRGTGKVLAGTVILAAVVSLPFYYTYAEFPRSPYPQAVNVLAGEVSPGAVIVHESKLSYFPSHYYAPDLPQVFLADAPDSLNNTLEPASQQAMQIFPVPDLQTAVAGHSKVFFVTYTRIFDEYKALGMDDHPHLTWLDEHYHSTGHLAFRDLEIYAFEQ